jgi:hypothetical protein
MKKFYVHDGNSQLGPFSIQELEELGISTDTPAWHRGLQNWTPAGKVNELAPLFPAITPPPFKLAAKGNSSHSPEPPQRKKRFRPGKVLMIICGLVIAVLLISFIGTNLSGNGSASFQYGMTVEEQEKADPARFLNATGKYRKNFWGDKVNIDGIIVSTATSANFKDALIRVTFYNDNKAVVAEKDFVIYEYVPARGSKEFKLKTDWPSGAKSCGWEVVNATGY